MQNKKRNENRKLPDPINFLEASSSIPMATMISSNSRNPATVLVGADFSSSPSSLFASPKKIRVPATQRLSLKIRAEAMATEKLGIKVERSPPESKLTELGVRQWPKWGCPPSKFPWTYSAKETCYLLKGKVKVYPEGSGDEYVEIGPGDFVVFPKGMSCTWDVSETIDKHYNFE